MKLLDFINKDIYTRKTIITDDKVNMLKIIRLLSYKNPILSLEIKSIKEYEKELCNLDLEIIDHSLAVYIIDEILNKDSLYTGLVPIESYSLKTSEEVLRIINILRANKTSSLFNDNMDYQLFLIKKLISEYEKYLKNNGLIDEILLASKALEHKETDEHKATFIFGELNDLEKELLVNLDSLTYEPEGDNSLSFTKAYGSYNEVENVIKRIDEDKLRFDDIAIYYPNNEYLQQIEALLKYNGLPYKSTSIPALSTDLINALIILIDFSLYNYTYSTLEDLFDLRAISLSYKDFISGTRAKISFGLDAYLNNELIEKCVSEEYFVFLLNLAKTYKKYEGNLDVKTADLLSDLLSLIKPYYLNKDLNCLDSFVDNLNYIRREESLYSALNFLKEQLSEMNFVSEEEEGKISLINIGNKANVSTRKYNFVLGLAESIFSIKQKESPVLNDKYLNAYLLESETHLSSYKQKIKEKAFKKSFAYLSDGEINYSYPLYDTVNSTDLSCSMLYLELLNKSGLSEKEYLSYDFIPEEYNVINKRIIKEKSETEEIKEVERSLSPSSLEELANCPLKFYYHYDRKLYVPEFKNYDPSIWLLANEKGTLVHAVFEDYINEVFVGKEKYEEFSEDRFERVYDFRFKETLKTCPISTNEAYQKESKKIKQACHDYLIDLHKELDKGPWKVYACEFEIDKDSNQTVITYENGEKFILHIKGFVDRIDYYDDETGFRHYRIVDYKTGTYKHKADEVNGGKTFQYYLYKKALNGLNKEDFKKGRVAEFAYVFPFETGYKKILKCPVDTEMPDSLKNAIYSYYFKKNYIKEFKSSENPCVYCDYGKCCFKTIKDLENE